MAGRIPIKVISQLGYQVAQRQVMGGMLRFLPVLLFSLQHSLALSYALLLCVGVWRLLRRAVECLAAAAWTGKRWGRSCHRGTASGEEWGDAGVLHARHPRRGDRGGRRGGFRPAVCPCYRPCLVPVAALMSLAREGAVPSTPSRILVLCNRDNSPEALRPSSFSSLPRGLFGLVLALALALFIPDQIEAFHRHGEEHGEVDVAFRHMHREAFQDQGEAHQDKEG